jgi:phosphomethylpyrimidine synthase
MKISEDSVPHCGTTEQGITEEEALKRGMEEKSKEFVQRGAEVYTKI